MKKTKKQKKIRSFKFPYILFAGLIVGALGSILLLTVFAEEESDGEWQVLCDVHHTANDDPIVFPKQPGASHLHSFYGNVSTNANTTTESLMANPSNCGRNFETTDRSAYWVPSVQVKQSNGTLALAPIKDQIAFIYYQRAGGRNGPRVLPFPNGLRMLAGNPAPTSPQPFSVVFWACGGGGGGARTSYIPHCPDPDQPIHATLSFPNCWNGKTLDSADHRSHMAYPGAGGICPGTHPVSLPQLLFNLDYYGIAGGPDHVLASGGQYSMHGDFFAAWDVQVQNALVAECLNIPRPCIGIERHGNTISKPSYDGDPIPPINIANYSTTPQTSGTLPPVAPAPAPAGHAKPKPAAAAATAPAAAGPSTAHDGHTDAASAEAEAISASQKGKPAAAVNDANTVKTSKKLPFAVAAAVLGLGAAGAAYYYFRVRRRI